MAASLALLGLLGACARGTPTTLRPTPTAPAPTSTPPAPTQTAQAPTPEPTGTPQRGLALVDEVEVAAPAEPGGEARAVMRGQLPDGCTVLGEAVVERQGEVFVISLYTARQAGAGCAGRGADFEHAAALETAGLPAGDYVVVANGVTASLRLGPAEAASEATPTATAEPESQATPSPAPTTTAGGGPSNCVDKAAFYGDVTVPDDTLFRQGEAFVKTWKVRNEGTCTWQGYRLVFAGGEQMSGPLSSPLPEAAPGDIIEISVSLVAPTRGGSHLGNWEFQDAEGRRFGVGASGKGPVWVRVQVNYSGREETVPPPDEVGNLPPPSAANPCGATRNASYESEVLRLINAARSAQGLPTLSGQAQLWAAAGQHGQDMACHDFISHTGTDGTSWKHRVAAHGYANYNSAREIIYAGDAAFGADPQGAFDWWMNSQVHHDIILHEAVSELGVAAVTNPSRPNSVYYTVVFARP